MKSESVAVALKSVFEGHSVTVLTVRGQSAFIAREIGEAIGYSDDGGRFSKKISNSWQKELIEGKDYEVFTGSELDALKALGPETVPSRAPSLTVLYKSGLWLALAKSHMPDGIKFRRWLVDEVLPQIEADGSYSSDREVINGKIVSKPRRTETAADREQRLLRQFQVNVLSRGVKRLEQLGTLSPMSVAAMEVEIMELATGKSYPHLLPKVEVTLLNATQIGERLGCGKNVVGTIANELKIKDDPECVEQVWSKSPYSAREQPTYVYKPAGVAKIEEEYRRRQAAASVAFAEKAAAKAEKVKALDARRGEVIGLFGER